MQHDIRSVLQMKQFHGLLTTEKGCQFQNHEMTPPERFFQDTKQLAGTYLYTWLDGDPICRVKCLAQNHNTWTPARLKSGPFVPQRVLATC